MVRAGLSSMVVRCHIGVYTFTLYATCVSPTVYKQLTVVIALISRTSWLSATQLRTSPRVRTTRPYRCFQRLSYGVMYVNWRSNCSDYRTLTTAKRPRSNGPDTSLDRVNHIQYHRSHREASYATRICQCPVASGCNVCSGGKREPEWERWLTVPWKEWGPANSCILDHSPNTHGSLAGER